MSQRQKLELTWIGKADRPKLEPRILIENTSYSHSATTKGEDDIFNNYMINGDNLLSLKALEKEFAGAVKCIFIDPPYNTGSAFEHYDDGVEHSIWLSLMRDRLEALRSILAENGSIWITIDDNECHYLKILCDEIFGRRNFVANVVWQKKFSPQNDAKWISNSHDHILCYAKNKKIWRPNALPRSTSMDDRYKNPDNDPRGPWASTDITRAEHRDRDYWGLITPAGMEVFPARGRSWSRPRENIERLKEQGLLWFGPNGDRMPRLKKFLTDMDGGLTPQTLWLHDEVGNNQEAKKETIRLNPESVFDTPKPERLIQRIVHLATSPGDIVLDSFAGSGTTGAVAHKMRRRWIMIELGEHAVTHCVPRLQKVIDGHDVGGITEATGWVGGGGFCFYRLAPSLLERDKWGNWIVSKDYNPAMLAEAMCKHMGFTYAPSQEAADYWNHGYSSERDFIYVTTQALTHGMLAAISNDVGPERRLLVCCKAFSGNVDAFENLTVRKIPQTILTTCEWGRDDYSLRIAGLPAIEPVAIEDPDGADTPAERRGRKRKAVASSDAPGLFDAASEMEE